MSGLPSERAIKDVQGCASGHGDLPAQVEEWFVACLFVVGPKAHMRHAQEFFRTYIPNGSGCAWYAAWFMEWLYDKQREVRDEY